MPQELEVGKIYKALVTNSNDPNFYFFIGTFDGLEESGGVSKYRFLNAVLVSGDFVPELKIPLNNPGEPAIYFFVELPATAPAVASGGYRKRGRKVTRRMNRKARKTRRSGSLRKSSARR